MKVFWFGDSWCSGSELAYISSDYRGELKERLMSVDMLSKGYFKGYVKGNRPDLAFPALITKELNLDSYYYVLGGASINKLYYWLLSCIKQFEVKDSIAIFSLPTQWKRYHYIDNYGDVVENTLAEDTDLMFKVQLERGFYDTTTMLNLMYYTCIANNIKPYFFSCWRPVEILEDILTVPEENFYFPLTTTLTELSWKSPVIGKVNPEIYPNKGHPNVEGQQKLAKTLLPYVKNSLLIK